MEKTNVGKSVNPNIKDSIEEYTSLDDVEKAEKNIEEHSIKPIDTLIRHEIVDKAKTITFWGFLFIGLYLLVSNFPLFTPNVIDPKAGLLLVFFIGFLTSFHCIGMCSGLVLAYTTNNQNKGIKPHACYNAGRIISYTSLGVLLGFAGSIVSFTDGIRGLISLLAGLFLLLYGLSLFYPKLRKYTTFPFSFSIIEKYGKNPILLGLLNGFMPCGPLQAMLIYAAGTGDPITGGLTMLAFGLGTVPLMFFAGVSLHRIGMKWTKHVVKFASVLMIVLGIIMFQRATLLLGIQIPAIGLEQFQQQTTNQINLFKDGYQTIYMNITRYGWQPSTLTVVKGIPVKWVITANELNYCNKGIKVPKLGISYTFNTNGEQKTFEFTPTETGTIAFTCWMGMIPGEIKVVESMDEMKNVSPGIQNSKKTGCGCGAGQCSI